ncbi:TIGR02594 family protein [Flavobacterium saccharophilum]|uniref:TIGR02594 family protein n=1 Tax=Flavobacterium saccharophilum TaxID=29534 RepID=A0A1M7ARZ9_9FLAO|nr:TIGR02594 family protein [Flavobacterium saccharophilum]SHL45542.1 TIGR02594 family protein [Flavobacterium saccharophilum]
MSKLKIYGKANPVVGIKEYYSINDFFGSSHPTSLDQSQFQSLSDDEIKWSIWVLERGSWVKKSDNNKTGRTVHYTFYQRSLTRKGIRMLVDVNGEKAVLDIKTEKSTQGKIVHVDLLDNNYNKPTRPFAYGDWIIAKVHCVDMELLPVKVTLWEDDGDKTKQNTTNVRIETKISDILNGIAYGKFYLNPSHAWLANAKLAKGDKNEGEFHEYYVTAEIFEKISKRVASKNANIPNPDYKPEAQAPKKQTPAEKKGPSKKEEKGIAKSDKNVHDYYETKVSVKNEISTNPVWEKINSVMKVWMPDEKNKKENTCVCKENNFYWSNKLTCKERKKVLEVCSSLWGEANKKEKASELMSIIHLESANTFSPSVDNGVGFSGLIQFSDAAAKSVGTTRSALKKMTFIEQMDYVKKYFEPKKNQLITMTDLYLLVVKPNAVGHGNNPDYILFDESISVPDGDGSNTSYEQRMININREPWVTKYGYASNPPFMKENDEHKLREKWVYTRQRKEQRWGFHNGKTTVAEVTQELKEEHYDRGASQIFKGRCEDIEEEKSESTDFERAPWMKLAWIEEAKKLKETGSNEEIQKFFNNTPYEKSMKKKTENEKDIPWCAAFVNWVMTNYGYTGLNRFDTVRALKWATWPEGKDLKKPIYGAIAVKTRKGGGHVGFVVGKKGSKIVILGGNQGNALQCVTYNESDYFAYVVPKNYDVMEDEYNLVEYNGNPAKKTSEK